MNTVNTSSWWFAVKTWALPKMSIAISIGFVVAAVWFIAMTILNGGYALLPPVANLCDSFHLDSFIQKEIKEGVNEPDANLFLILAKYVLFKNALLVIILLGARYVFLQIV